MSNQFLLGAVIAMSASVLLIIYSGHANQHGLMQGTYFQSGKAMLLGWLGLLASILICFFKTGTWDLLIAVALSYFLSIPILLSWFREKVQIMSLIGLPAGLYLLLTTNN
ncbi:hypothetical protein [Limnohabitans sp. T6-20]|uniref:hypothetical protein n=1 Tax=Limnohabitans sp. T6-20 TaxID=1100725 RepID=UPI0011B2912B|nr:hypothetical protein [Limnohabitans sp. T6-20]